MCIYLGRIYKDQGSDFEKCVLTEKPPVHIGEPCGRGRDKVEQGEHDVSASLSNGVNLFDSAWV